VEAACVDAYQQSRARSRQGGSATSTYRVSQRVVSEPLMANRRRTGGPGPRSRQCRRNGAHGGTIAGSGNRGATFRRCVCREPAAGSCAVLCTGGRRPRRVWARFVLPPQHCPGPDEFQRERRPHDRHVSLISGHKPGSKRLLCHHRRVRSNAAILDGIPPLNILKEIPEQTSQFDYSPLWDIHLETWTNAAVTAGLNVRQTDFSAAAEQVTSGLATGFPAGAQSGPSGFVVNCPVVSLDVNPGG